MITTRTVVLLLALLAADHAPAQPLTVEPGLWTIRLTPTVNGQAQPDKAQQLCFTPEQARDIVATLTASAGVPQEGCQTAHSVDGNVLSLSAQCDRPTERGRISIKGGGRYTFESATRITGQITTQFASGGSETTMNVTVEANRVGACP